MTNLQSQDIRPELTLLVGGRTKRKAAKDLFGLRNLEEHGAIRLEDSERRHDQLLLADCELHNQKFYDPRPVSSHCKSHLLRWADTSKTLGHVAYLLYLKVLMKFATIVCVFADDFGTLDDFAKMLAAWAYVLGQEECPADRVKIIILLRWRDQLQTFDEKLAKISLENRIIDQIRRNLQMSSKSPKMWLDALGELTVLHLPAVSTRKHLNTTYRRLCRESRETHSLREIGKRCFSAYHLGKLLSFAVEQFCSTHAQSIELIDATRVSRPLPQNATKCTKSALTKLARHLDLHECYSLLASALSLDAFPPGSHCKY